LARATGIHRLSIQRGSSGARARAYQHMLHPVLQALQDLLADWAFGATGLRAIGRAAYAVRVSFQALSDCHQAGLVCEDQARLDELGDRLAIAVAITVCAIAFGCVFGLGCAVRGCRRRPAQIAATRTDRLGTSPERLCPGFAVPLARRE
jgi:hypothetical protein